MIETLKKEIWAKDAIGIEVRIHNATGELVAKFLIDKGNWKCLIDKLNISSIQ